MKYFKVPSGQVKFAVGSLENLPYEAEEVKLYMRSGDPMIYIIPVSEMPYSFIKTVSKSEGLESQIEN